VKGFSLQMMSSKAAGKTAVVAGATGYIGKSVVRESVRQGYKTVALVRSKEKVNSKEGQLLYGQFFEGADIVECDVTDPEQLTKVRLSNLKERELFFGKVFEMLSSEEILNKFHDFLLFHFAT
jgi:NAD(P)-dependent dehydrogenase (short-subunit alcohol dehydrogenase family)